MKKKVWKNVVQFLAAAVFLLAVWGIAYVFAGNEFVVPSFFDCVKATGRLLVDGGFWQAFGGTLLRVLLAFIPSFVVAFVLAVTAYVFPTFGGFFAPVVSVLRSVPTLAVLLIILVSCGAGVAPVIVAFLSLFPILYAGILAALSGVDKDLVEMSRVYKVPLKKQIVSLFVPTALPYVAKEAAAATAFCLKLVVSAEVLTRTVKSLGGLMQDAKIYMEIPTLFALVLVTAIVGLLLEGLGALLLRLCGGKEGEQ